MAKIMEINKNLQVRALIELNSYTSVNVFISNSVVTISQNNNSIDIDKVETKSFCEAILELLKESEIDKN